MKKISILLVLLFTLLLTGCKGEELNFGKELVKVNGMVDILTELDTKSSDVGIMDSIMAGYYINQQYKGKLTIVKDVFREQTMLWQRRELRVQREALPKNR